MDSNPSPDSPTAIHAKVQDAFNAGDLDALVALYEPDASMATPEGIASGRDEIRANWRTLLDMNGHMEMTSRYEMIAGDIALIRNDYTLTAGDLVFSGATAEVVRRQVDGTWLYVLDNPFGGGELP